MEYDYIKIEIDFNTYLKAKIRLGTNSIFFPFKDINGSSYIVIHGTDDGKVMFMNHKYNLIDFADLWYEYLYSIADDKIPEEVCFICCYCNKQEHGYTKQKVFVYSIKIKEESECILVFPKEECGKYYICIVS